METRPNLSFEIRGTGKNVLLFIHGFLESKKMWENIISELENDFTCVAVDLPGHGESGDWLDYSIQELAEKIAEWISKKAITIDSIIGHSLGGYVGLELKKLMSCQLILLHSNFWADNENKKKDRDRVIDLVKTKKNQFIQEAIPNLFFKENVKDLEAEIYMVVKEAQNTTLQGVIEATKAMRDRPANYDVLMPDDVIIHGDQDPIIATSVLEKELEKLKANPIIYTLDECGHMSTWEQPEALNITLNSILIQ